MDYFQTLPDLLDSVRKPEQNQPSDEDTTVCQSYKVAKYHGEHGRT